MSGVATVPMVPCLEDMILPDEVVHPHPYLATLEVGGSQLSDVIEHVSNIEYVRWLDRAAELHSDDLGWTRKRLLEESVMWFVARHEVDYLAETWSGDRLVVATWVRDMRRVRSWRDTVIFRPPSEADVAIELVCRASTLWVLVDLTSRRPKAIPADMVMAFDPLEGPGRSPPSSERR